MEIIGLQMESYAKLNITANHAVDTGLLRNSITHAVAGGSVAARSYSNDAKTVFGSYADTAIGDKTECTAFVGSNVEYAP